LEHILIHFLKFFPHPNTSLENVEEYFSVNEIVLGGYFSLRTSVYHAPSLVKTTGMYFLQGETYLIFQTSPIHLRKLYWDPEKKKPSPAT
jgi:hypothetical protein